eukprot:CAMPEP_0116870528 /NCGR_PEP_ID=MMETSP0463-20121206/463_1 /TAXON_ID=181622 /ORGANISM="Strombidinopsis sp, Strain SopsisLIS2011" /LENGTH=44 /DNA_ID= /DNA_START= /DNA_END= /DNA_ORIENTATION=
MGRFQEIDVDGELMSLDDELLSVEDLNINDEANYNKPSIPHMYL